MGNDIRLENFHIERVILRKRELLRKLLGESRKKMYIFIFQEILNNILI